MKVEGAQVEAMPEPAAFVAARGDALLRLAWLLTTDGPAAEDLVQEALARVLPRWNSISPGKHEAYVRTAIRSVWIDGFRRRAARVRLDVVPDVPEVASRDDGPGQADLRISVRSALLALSPRQRTVLVLRFYEDLTEVETARSMNCSVSTVKSQTRDALARLRERAPELKSLLTDKVPPVTTVHMDRARMLLAMLGPDGSTSDGMNSRPVHGVAGRGPVVLSADGKTYAALPYDPKAGNYTLSRDGRRVAWATVTVKAKRATIAVHAITLSEGVVRSVVLPAETVDERPTSLFFDSADGHRLVIFTRSVTGVPPKQAHLWSWTPDSAGQETKQLCSCLPTRFGLSPDGQPWQATNRLGYYPAVKRSPAKGIGVPTWAGDKWGMDLATDKLVVSDTGQVVRGLVAGLPRGSFREGDPMPPLQLTLAGPGGTTVVAVQWPTTGPVAKPVVDLTARPQAWPLDWTTAGIVSVYETGKYQSPDRVSSLLLIDPDTGRSRTIGVGDGRSVPLAVSTALPTDPSS